jgi:hypothetical protein
VDDADEEVRAGLDGESEEENEEEKELEKAEEGPALSGLCPSVLPCCWSTLCCLPLFPPRLFTQASGKLLLPLPLALLLLLPLLPPLLALPFVTNTGASHTGLAAAFLAWGCGGTFSLLPLE